MKKIIGVVFAGSLSFHASSQSPTIIQRDPLIAKMVSEVSADSLKSYVTSMVSYGTRHTLSTQKDAKRGIGAARIWVLGKFNEFVKQSNGRLSAKIDTITYMPDGKRVDSAIILGNVMATLKGADPNDKRIFVIIGHLDSRRTNIMDRTGDAPGANDDASGVAGLIECARIMSKNAFPATVIFSAMSGEEQGLLGANFMADKAKKENWQIEALLNNDIIGSNNSNETNIINNTQVRVFSEGLPGFELEQNAKAIKQLGLENDGNPRQLSRYVKETGERYVDNLQVMLIYRTDRFMRGGDHTPFADRGFTAVRICEMNENFNHQHQNVRTEKGIVYADLVEFMDFEYLRKNTALNLATLSNLAKSPSMPQEVTYVMEGLGNSTTINWKPSLTGKVKGYYLLVRESSSPVWQKKFFSNETSLKIPYSKDNYLFAVQSVSEDGNESLPVIPKVPVRQAVPAQRPASK